VKYSRRGSALLVNVFVVYRIAAGQGAAQVLTAKALTYLPYLGDLTPSRFAVLALLTWYAFLSQLKIRWAFFWLPIYLLLFPMSWLFGFVISSAWKRLGLPVSTTEPTPQSAAPAGRNAPPRRRHFPTRRVWALLFFVWLIPLQGLKVPWAVWIPPFLAFPIWLWLMWKAYKAAVAPKAFAQLSLTSSASLLEGTLKSFREARAKGTKPQDLTMHVARKVANSTLGRYSADKLISVIQQEAILIFSVALIITVLASAAFWGLVARALILTKPGVMNAYHFFSTRSFGEAVLWAIGCMTTSISFPGEGAAVGLKILHAVVLGTGIFEVTYLLACFSVMVNSEGQRVAKLAAALVPAATKKLDELSVLEGELTAPPGQPPPHPDPGNSSSPPPSPAVEK
jgi:hypothetical protein